MRGQKLCDAQRIFAVRAHPTRQCLHSAMHQPAIERGWHGTAGSLDLAHALEEFILLPRDQGAAHDIAMAAEIFRGRVHDYIRAEREVRWMIGDQVLSLKYAGLLRDLRDGGEIGRSQWDWKRLDQSVSRVDHF
jgi:hypothetical protein